MDLVNRIDKTKHLSSELRGRIISLYRDSHKTPEEVSQICNVSVSNKKK